MSAENFIKLFKSLKADTESSAYLDYVHYIRTNKTFFNKNRDELEALGLSKRVGFTVSEDTAKALGVSEAFESLSKQFVNADDGPQVSEVNGVKHILFPDVAFKDGIEKTLDKMFGQGTSAKAKAQGLVKGHIYGFMTGAIIGARNDLQEFLTAGSVPILGIEEADKALEFLDILIKHLGELDLASAQLTTLTTPVYLKYNKSATNFLIELQTASGNSESAKLVAKLAGQKSGSTGIRALVNPTSTQKNALAGILEVLRKDGKFTPKELVEFESSPSMVDLIEDTIVSALTGKPKKLKSNYSNSGIKLPVDNVIAYVNKVAQQEYRAKLKKVKQDAIRNKAKIAANKTKLDNSRIPKFSLSSLQVLLDRHLQDVLSANMGDGSAHNVLNYRTGRFAASAKVERLSQSKEGMITAYYTAMRNPYYTFSQGGAQQYPKTRDPKLLISKSIAEIAATLVGNRMRSVAI